VPAVHACVEGSTKQAVTEVLEQSFITLFPEWTPRSQRFPPYFQQRHTTVCLVPKLANKWSCVWVSLKDQILPPLKKLLY